MGHRASKWTKQTIIESILRHHDLGEDLTPFRMRRADQPLLSAALRHFGGWRQAVEAAGVNYEAVKLLGKRHRRVAITKWTQASILRELRRLHALGQDVRPTAILARLPGLYHAARKQWRTWDALLEAAGISAQSAAAAAGRYRGWRRRWLRRLEAQALGLEPARERGDGGYQRAPLVASTADNADWLDSLLRG